MAPEADLSALTPTILLRERVDRMRAGDRLEVVEIAPLLAAAIERLHDNGSIVELVEGRDAWRAAEHDPRRDWC